MANSQRGFNDTFLSRHQPFLPIALSAVLRFALDCILRHGRARTQAVSCQASVAAHIVEFLILGFARAALKRAHHRAMLQRRGLLARSSSEPGREYSKVEKMHPRSPG